MRKIIYSTIVLGLLWLHFWPSDTFSVHKTFVSKIHQHDFKTTKIFSTKYLPINVAGLAFPVLNIVFVDGNYWKYLNQEEQVILIYHELIHIRWKLGHDDRRLPDGCYASLMSSSMDSWQCIHKHFVEYLYEASTRK